MQAVNLDPSFEVNVKEPEEVVPVVIAYHDLPEGKRAMQVAGELGKQLDHEMATPSWRERSLPPPAVAHWGINE